MKFLVDVLCPIIKFLNECYKEWTKPDTDSLIIGTVVDLTRGKQELICWKRFFAPAITQQDTRILVLLANKFHGWKDALYIVKPDTLEKCL